MSDEKPTPEGIAEGLIEKHFAITYPKIEKHYSDCPNHWVADSIQHAIVTVKKVIEVLKQVPKFATDNKYEWLINAHTEALNILKSKLNP